MFIKKPTRGCRKVQKKKKNSSNHNIFRKRTKKTPERRCSISGKRRCYDRVVCGAASTCWVVRAVAIEKAPSPQPPPPGGKVAELCVGNWDVCAARNGGRACGPSPQIRRRGRECRDGDHQTFSRCLRAAQHRLSRAANCSVGIGSASGPSRSHVRPFHRYGKQSSRETKEDGEEVESGKRKEDGGR